MRHRLRQLGYRLRDGFRDRVWEFADWLDPAVGAVHLDRALAMDDLQRYAVAGLSAEERLPWLIFATPAQIAEAALAKAAAEGFEGTLSEAARRPKEVSA